VKGAPPRGIGGEGFYLKTILLSGSDTELAQISKEHGVALSVAEMRCLGETLKRPLTDVELQTFGQTWSEHCIHKTFKGDILTPGGTIRSLFKSYIQGATTKLNKPWCISVFEDNAGLVEFDKGYLAAAKVETHNHPSAVEPFGGAATGVGGVIRDILGVWGEPVAVTDVLCFGPLDTDNSALPPGVKHPKYIFKGVVAGVGAYGNNMGIPNISGGVFFDDGYTGNVIVYCGCMGILPKHSFVRDTHAGEYAVLAGGKTGRDGIHGVTFASADLSEEASELRSAVQIPNPVVEERLKRATLRIRDRRLATGITDLGGGGISCATGEMAHRSDLGLDVNLDVVHLKESNMAPWEIWVSESQERMLYSVKEKDLKAVMEIFREEEIEACVLGAFNRSQRLKASFKGTVVCDLDLGFLYEPPRVSRRATSEIYRDTPCRLDSHGDLADEILKLLADPNLRSREDIIRTYDHEVRGCTVLKPLQGEESGHNDAGIIKPLKDSWMGLVISSGMNPFLPDPYWMAATSIEEAMRNNTAVGGRRIAILDNFVWGNPEKEDRMGSLLRACQACHDFSLSLDLPFISGKDSLFNESPLGPVRPTLLITAMGIIPDVRKSVSVDLKSAGDRVCLIGETREEMRGSAYSRGRGGKGGAVPKVDAALSRELSGALNKAMDDGLIMACHDCSEGGLAVAAAEMVLASHGKGIELDLRKIGTGIRRSDFAAFSESNSRYLIEVNEESNKPLQYLFRGLPCWEIGRVTGGGVPGLRLTDLEGREHSLSASEMRKAWRGH
jgi:phosphoribosylformylglycinamidine synthase II